MKTPNTEIKVYEDEFEDELLCVDIRGITRGARLVTLMAGRQRSTSA